MSVKIHLTLFILAFIVASTMVAQSFTDLEGAPVRQQLQMNGLIMDPGLS